MFPYPSGNGLHCGHWYNYAIMDSYCRYLRYIGNDVFQPFVYDAFGLPAENYAKKMGCDPKIITHENINKFREQMIKMNTCYTEKLTTSNASYQKWTQWLFLKLKEKGLSYKAFKFNKVVSSFMILLNKNKHLNLTKDCKNEITNLLEIYMPNIKNKINK